MTTEQAKQLSESAIAQLMDALERGQSEALKALSRRDVPLSPLLMGQILLIYSQRPDATHVAGFHAWLKLRRFVRKGEKGIVILAPMVGRKKSDDDLTEDAQTRLFGFRAAHVFDVSQTEGEPLPEFATVKGDPQDYNDRLIQFVTGRNIALEYDGAIAPAQGMSSGGKITLLPDLSPAEHLAVLVHELGHELLHRGDRRTATTHTIRETEAEAVAYVVSTAIGLDTSTSCSDYIQLHSGNKTTLAESLTFIQQTASIILQAIEPGEDAAKANHA